MSPQPFTLSAAIGNTPLVKITKLNPNPAVQIFAKLEGSNPGGSVKDRPAWYMIEKAIEDGSLTPDKTILEPTSGNTGIALAMIGASLGYHVKLVMPPCVSVERRSVLEAYGAEVVLSTQGQATDGAILLAHQIVKDSPDQYFMPNQYSNPNNPLAHYETTGPEIFRQCNGNIDVFIAGIGTSGTLMGTGRALKERDPSIRIIGVEPTLGHSVQGLKNMQEAIVPDIYHEENLDDKLVVEDDEAFNCARDLAIHEGLFVGMSSGAAVAGALRVAATMQSGTIVTLLPDRGDRYLSTSLFRSTCACCPP
ncbi:cysteine synthase family protein [uncultured Desulfuromonas sp.]|uniref:PLP-dependent cysteine synthase family protein n=1 Tax=uncultured Desulfuromonas sp. TaxID=181013 RepID=UPI002AAA7713|nr:cysteine synthase family protein [uncultured Desulfuromonas sp.]